MDSAALPDARRDFPEDFLFGAATAGHQVEGNNTASDWWDYEQRGSLPYASDRACDQFRRYREDFELARALGHNCHRFSLEWSRIEPKSGVWDDAAVDHYLAVLTALNELGLEPIVTLNHFTLPAWMQRRGGWASPESVARFRRYAKHVVERFGEHIKIWLTLNEPTVYTQQAYINGVWPPHQLRRWGSAVRVFRHQAAAHIAAYDTIKHRRPEANVGFAHSALHVMPCRQKSVLDKASARFRDYALNKLFFSLLGARRGSAHAPLDFVGLNYYTRCNVRFGGWKPSGLLGRACHERHHGDDGERSTLGTEVYPAGLAAELRRYADYELPIVITENGVATEDDGLRKYYIEQHLKVIADALSAQLDIIGYLHWSLIDNFEWEHGTTARYGLAEVDYATQERKQRDSAIYFSRICSTGRLE